MTLTVTEKGYSRRPDTGGLDTAAPGVAADLAATAGAGPGDLVTVVGRLTASLAARFRTCAAPIDVVSCDNTAANGAALAGVVRGFVEASAWPDRRDDARLAGHLRRLPGHDRRPHRPGDHPRGPRHRRRRARPARRDAGRGGALPAVGAAGLLRRGAAAVGARRRAGRPGRRALPADEAAPAQRLPLGHGLPGGGRGLPDGRRGAGDRVGRAAGAQLRRRGRADRCRPRGRTRRSTSTTWSNGSATPRCSTCCGRSGRTDR